MDSQVDLRQAVWTRYWAHGASHSCGGSYGKRYGGALAQWWRAAFAELPAGARVLDIATGNGALPQLLLDYDQAGTLSCDAVDLAALAPAWFAEVPDTRRALLRFHGQQAAESLPFGDAQFDLVMSQYGLEYTDLARSVPELLRVLTPRGKIRLVVHHKEARPVLLAATELEHLAWLNAPGNLLETASELLEPMARARSEAGRASLASDQAAIGARAHFNALQPLVTQMARNSNCPDVLLETREAIGAILNIAMSEGEAQARQAMGQLRADLTDSAVRLRELCDYALDEEGAQRLSAALAGSAGKAALAPLHDQSVLMGWSIGVER